MVFMFSDLLNYLIIFCGLRYSSKAVFVADLTVTVFKSPCVSSFGGGKEGEAVEEFSKREVLV